MSTNLSGNILTLNNTSLEESYIKEIHKRFYIPDNCKAGDTIILDGIECLCVATGVAIQGSNLTRIAVDKNHDLGYYQKYAGIYIDGLKIDEIRLWRWGGYGTSIGTSLEVGYGLQNTINCLANTVSYTKGSSSNNRNYPFMWQGVNDFRSSHSDKWFVPSIHEFYNYIYPIKSSLSYDESTGGNVNGFYWSSSEYSLSGSSYYMSFSSGNTARGYKDDVHSVRLCRAF